MAGDRPVLDQQQAAHARRQALDHRILGNPVYIGKIAHTRGSHLPKGKDRGQTEIWPGLHEPIIDLKTWDWVQALMDEHRERSRTSMSATHLLRGKIHTFEGYRLTPGNTSSRRQNGRTLSVACRVSGRCCAWATPLARSGASMRTGSTIWCAPSCWTG